MNIDTCQNHTKLLYRIFLFDPHKPFSEVGNNTIPIFLFKVIELGSIYMGIWTQVAYL